MTKRRCAATTSKGQPCKAWAVRGTDPPRCAPHGGGERPVGAPKDNRNAEKHGWYAQKRPSPDAIPSASSGPGTSSGFYAATPDQITIDDAIADLADKMARLDHLIQKREQSGGNGELAYLFSIYTQASSRLARMLRDRRALSGEAADGIAGALAIALDEIATELGLVADE